LPLMSNPGKEEKTAKVAKNAKPGFRRCKLQTANCRLAARPCCPGASVSLW
jgi:hypothetical protein